MDRPCRTAGVTGMNQDVPIGAFETGSLWQALTLPGRIKKSGLEFHPDIAKSRDLKTDREITVRIFLTLGLSIFCAFLIFGSSDSQMWLFIFLLCVPLPLFIAWIVRTNDLRWKALATQVFTKTQPVDGTIKTRKIPRQQVAFLQQESPVPGNSTSSSEYRIAFVNDKPEVAKADLPESSTTARLFFDPRNNDLIIAQLDNDTRLWCKTQARQSGDSWQRWNWILLGMTGYLLFAAAVMWFSGNLFEYQLKQSRRDWVTAPAKIVASTKLKRYGFGWTYEYKIGDAIYHSTRIGYTRAGSNLPAKLGDSVEVIYDPKDPSKCVLSSEAAELSPISSGRGLATALVAFSILPLIIWLLDRTKPRAGNSKS